MKMGISGHWHEVFIDIPNPSFLRKQESRVQSLANSGTTTTPDSRLQTSGVTEWGKRQEIQKEKVFVK